MTMIFNTSLIDELGGNLCGEDRLSIQACNQCQGQYLFNAELNDVYFDPADLSKHFFKIPAISLPPCRYCGAINWDFSSVDLDKVSILSGPWGWVLTQTD